MFPARTLHHPLLALVIAIPLFAMAGGQDPHHPASASASAVAGKAPATTPIDGKASMDAPMKAMQEMHEKMLKARTPEERQALMHEHMKAMRDGMATMNHMMHAGPPEEKSMQHGARQKQMDMMQKRMDMMQTMMQMMLDRLPDPGPAK